MPKSPFIESGKNIKATAIHVLEQESAAIKRLVATIDADFERCVEAILAANGRLVVTGIGKSAIVGQKIVATLNSTGTPALFMHAADAIHGDLGMIQPNDMVMAISKSGDTPEIKVLVPLLKRLGVRIIGLISNRMSYLGNHADFVLHAHAPKEADPNDLAPTTSTTVAMALGDALAVCLLQSRGFSKNDFAKYHPGGTLGKRLYLKVSDIYPTNPVPKVSPQDTLLKVIFEISSNRLGATAVVDENDRLLGIVTDGDLARTVTAAGEKLNFSMTAREMMTSGPTAVDEDEYAANALQIMQARSISQLLIVRRERLLGFVHLHDLLREGLI